MSAFDPLVEKIMQFYTAPAFREDVNEAKYAFQEIAGSFDEGSADFESRISQFTDWYVFTRKMKRVGQVPVEYCLEDPKFPMKDADRARHYSLRNSRHSLFEFVKVKGEDVFVRDLFSGFEYVLRNSRVTIGFNRDELFEARLIPYENEYVFSGSFCLHPAQVSAFIAKEILKANKKPDAEHAKAREELLMRLFKMKQKHEQYRHLKLTDVYSNESKLRI